MAAAMPSLSPELIQEILDSPASPPPPGEVANMDNPPLPLTNIILATLVLAIIFTTAFTAARMYTRAFIIRTVGWEDVLCVLAWLSFMAFVAMCFITQSKAGIHLWNLRIRDVEFLLYWVNYIEIVYSIIIIFVKCSILLQYRRIFVPTRQTSPLLYFGIWFMFYATIIFYVALLFFEIFECTPREAIWNKLIPATCIDPDGILISGASFNLASDVIIFLLPQPTIWTLRMSTRRKIGLSIVFGLGGLACVVTALRVQSTMQVINTLDISWFFGPLGLWCVCEISLAIIAASLPTMPKFVEACSRRLTGKPKTSTATSSSGDPIRSAEEGKAGAISNAMTIPRADAEAKPASSPAPVQVGSRYTGTWFQDEPSPTKKDMVQTTVTPIPPTVRSFSRPLIVPYRHPDEPVHSPPRTHHSASETYLDESLQRAIDANRAAQRAGRSAPYDGYEDYLSRSPDSDDPPPRTTRRSIYE